ncbi:MAG: hypothetical protein A3K65_10000 [Euryarchaeota archaeon RBG_16_68_12]|nr:MAG: hypothetical protein A3K65_10000 [Euryarchaeota archaeon RBG_16_68_12]
MARSSKLTCGIPRHDFTYPPSTLRTSPSWSSKSFHALNWLFAVSSARTPEYTAFFPPSTSTSRFSTLSTRAVNAMLLEPSRSSTIFTGVAFADAA